MEINTSSIDTQVHQLQSDIHANDSFETKPETFWARWVSNLLSPPVIWGALAFPIAFRQAESTTRGVVWALVYILLVCILPALYIVWQVWRGNITDIHVRLRAQRIRPFLISLVCTLMAFIVLNALGAPRLVSIFAFFSLIQISVMLLITFQWQISMHAMAITSAIVTMALLFGGTVALLFAPLIPVVGAARYTLRRHTIRQIIAGGIVGGVVTTLLIIFTQPLS